MIDLEERKVLLKKVEKGDNINYKKGLYLIREGLIKFDAAGRPERPYTDDSYNFDLTNKGREFLGSLIM